MVSFENAASKFGSVIDTATAKSKLSGVIDTDESLKAMLSNF